MGVFIMPEDVETRMFRKMREAQKKRKPLFPEARES